MVRKCHECHRTSLTRIEMGTITEDDRFLGPITVTGVAFERCSNCGYTLYCPGTLDALLQATDRKLDSWLRNQPVRDYFTSEETADFLNVTKQALSKNKRIKRGFIYHIRKGKQLLYLKRSVELYGETGDGRFAIDVPEVDSFIGKIVQEKEPCTVMDPEKFSDPKRGKRLKTSGPKELQKAS